MSSESIRARRKLKDAHEDLKSSIDTFSRDLDEELVKHEDEVKEIHNRNRRRLADILAEATKTIDKEIDELEISRGKSIQAIERLGAKFKGKAVAMENR
eukprot:75138-Karenia_brevis.AAC.1